VVAPGLPFELLGCQVLLVSAWLVVEGEEQRLRVQLGIRGRVIERGMLDGGVACRHAPRELAHAWRHMLPLTVLLRGRRPPACTMP